MNKIIITAAICGAEVTKEMNPAVPYTVNEIAAEAKRAADAGASIIHLHVRHDDGTPTQDIMRYKECIDAISDVAPSVIVLPSTGGAIGQAADERIAPVSLKPEIASLDCGSCNFGDEIFENALPMLRTFCKQMMDNNVKPECEVFEKGHIDTALNLARQGFIRSPIHFNIVLGVPGAANADIRTLSFMAESLPPDATWCVTGIGKSQFEMGAASIIMGGHIRVGFEDNLYLSKNVLAKSNGELTERAAAIIHLLGKEVATPADAREILGL